MANRRSAHSKRYINSWAVEVRGGKEHADEVARRNGFENRGQVSVPLHLATVDLIDLQVGEFSDIYEFVKIGPEKNNIKSDTPYPTSLEAEKRVGLFLIKTIIQTNKSITKMFRFSLLNSSTMKNVLLSLTSSRKIPSLQNSGTL